MTYTTEDAYSDAYGDALNDFTDDAGTIIRDLIMQNCPAGRFRAAISSRIENDDALVADFLREALARLDSERQNRPSAQPLKGETS